MRMESRGSRIEEKAISRIQDTGFRRKEKRFLENNAGRHQQFRLAVRLVGSNREEQFGGFAGAFVLRR
jgi:hypothetical protein